MEEDQASSARKQLAEMITREPRRLPGRIRRLLRDDEAAEDLAQEALLRALRNLGTLRGVEEGVICKWLDRIACHVALNHSRDSGRQPDKVSIDADTGTWTTALPTSEPEPEDVALLTELQQTLLDAIRTLPDEFQAVFVLRDIEELSTAETAAELNIGEGLVKWRLHQARQRLRKLLAEPVTPQDLDELGHQL
jgi:RNA polymerase sigma-70 factor (ECF subfamily)